MAKTIEFCGELKRETPKAYLVHDGKEDVWIPRSQVKSIRQIDRIGVDFEFEIPVWLAREKGIV